MTDLIPRKARAIAAGLQAIATLPSASAILISSNLFFNYNVTSEFSSIIIGILSEFFPTLSMFIILSPIITWILWRFTKSIHPFIDDCGKYAINHALNSSLAVMFSAVLFAFVFSVTCGGSNTGSGSIAAGLLILTAGSIVVGCVALTYFISSIVAGIKAWNGSYFESGFIYPFVR